MIQRYPPRCRLIERVWHMKQDENDSGGQLAPHEQERMNNLLDKLVPHMADLLYQGAVMKKFPTRPNSPYVLKFRQDRTGKRDGRQKKLYVGPKWLADELMAEIWRRREETGVRYRHGHEPWYLERKAAGILEMPDQFSDLLRRASRRMDLRARETSSPGKDIVDGRTGDVNVPARTEGNRSRIF